MTKKQNILPAVRLLFLCLLFFALTACKDEMEGVSTEQLMEKAFAFANEGRWDETLKYSEEAYKQRPDDTSVRLLHAFALENNGRDNEALEVGRHASGDTKSYLAQYNYGRMLFQRKRYDQAQIYLKQALALKNNDFNTLILLQQSAARLNQNAENQKYCKILWDLFSSKRGPDFSSYIYNELSLNILCGRPVLTQNNVKLVKNIFSRAAKTDPASPELEWNQAIFYDFYINDPGVAREHYKKFLKLTERYSGMEKERAAVNSRLNKLGN